MLPKRYSAIFCCCNAYFTFRKNTYFASLIQQGRTSTNYEQAITQGNGNSGVSFCLSISPAEKNWFLKGSRRARTFSRHNSPISRDLADRNAIIERLWFMSRAILARISSENSCVPFKNSLVRPAKWKGTQGSLFTVLLCLSYSLSHEICMHENGTKMRPFSNFCYAVIFTVFSSVLFLQSKISSLCEGGVGGGRRKRNNRFPEWSLLTENVCPVLPQRWVGRSGKIENSF